MTNTSSLLKRAIFVSLLGHLTLFSIFNFSFGRKIPNLNYVSVISWGQLLQNRQVAEPSALADNPRRITRVKEFVGQKKALTDYNREPFLLSTSSFKPQLPLIPLSEKETFSQKSSLGVSLRSKTAPAIIFHPLLPYSFVLYFKDRQVAHVELMFNISLGSLRNAILVKRKISSGNLEGDLLSMRYISRYLFIQKAEFTPNNWQTVKIDLSAKND